MINLLKRYYNSLVNDMDSVVRYRPNNEDELKNYSYGLSAISSVIKTLDKYPTVNASFIIERRISELNTLIGASTNDEQRLMYSIQSDFLTDLYDQTYLR